MSERQPTHTKNLDGYGNPPLEWSRARDALTEQPAGPGRSYFLATVRPDGRPHAAGVGAVYHDGDMYVVSGPNTRKSRNLAANPACTISAGLEGLDLVLEGEATRVTDAETLERLAAIYRDLGWPATVEGDAFTAPFSAPSAGPPPWHVYRVVVSTVFGVAGAEPHGATRWTFSPPAS
jgi:Pyridoxamine 5'-phosphate oxidase